MLQGSDAVGIAGEVANPIYSLIVKPEIKSYADLKGKLIGAVGCRSTRSRSRRASCWRKHGVEATATTGSRQLVGTPVRFDCLRRGDCDAVPLGQPEDFDAVQQGYRRLGAIDRGGAAISSSR